MSVQEGEMKEDGCVVLRDEVRLATLVKKMLEIGREARLQPRFRTRQTHQISVHLPPNFSSLHQGTTSVCLRLPPMRRWSTQAARSTLCARPIRLPLRLRHAAAGVTNFRHLSTTSESGHDSRSPPPPSTSQFRINAVFDTIARPEGGVDAWMALLDGALPPHLRDWSNDISPPPLSALDVAGVLHEAQHPQDTKDPPFDLLFYMGFNQGRWDAVVWLVKKLVHKFPVRHPRNGHLPKVFALWNQSQLFSLEESTRYPVQLSVASHAPSIGALAPHSLDDFTSVAENCRPEEVVRHEALGQIWRTLGAMTKACAGEEIRPEVLEIIALLHHEGVMPMSIYHSDRHPDSSAIQQPRLLSLVSSRIMTSLSDAAWRAHEKLVVEEAKAKGGRYAAMRPELPGAMYKVRVAGLRPEVWMELILWSCLRGGWLLPGADILRSIAEDSEWRPLSWQKHEQAVSGEDRLNSEDWDDLEYQFKTGASSTRDAPNDLRIAIGKTVSAEVVNAYIDALAGTVDVGVGNRVIDIEEATLRLPQLKSFLYGREFLSTGTWEALVLRLIESQGGVSNQHAATIQRLVYSTPVFKQRLAAYNTKGLPSYVLDGNMALHGLLLRVLSEQIAEESFAGALETFKKMRLRSDFGRKQSIIDFVGHIQDKRFRKARSQVLGASEMFTGNFAGLEYPELNLQIPTTILARFLELSTDAKAYEFGRYLLYGEDVDAPLIGESLYKNRYIQPAVVRFAVESNDRELLATLRDNHNLSRVSYREVFDQQVNALQWESAGRILQHLTDTAGRKWSLRNLATVVSFMLTQSLKAKSGDVSAQSNFNAARALFDEMIKGKYSAGWSRTERKANLVHNLAAVLVSTDSTWANLCTDMLPRSGYQTFELPVHPFNVLLSGVVSAYGSAAGKRLVETFCPLATRAGPRGAYSPFQEPDKNYRTLPKPAAPLESAERQRIAVSVPGLGIKNDELVLYGSLEPNTKTIMIVLSRALDELSDAQDQHGPDKSISESAEKDNIAREHVTWAVRHLAKKPYVDAGIVRELGEALVQKGLHDVVSELPEIVYIIEADALAGLEESEEAGEEPGQASFESNPTQSAA